MKKLSLLVVALIVSATTIAKTTLPFIVSDKDASGKYGYVQDGKEIIPHIFDKAGAFYEGSVLSYAVFEKEYYIIDRNGNIVDENNPNRSYPPETYRHYAIIDRGATGIDIDASAGIVIDVNGKRLFPNHYAYPISVTAPNGKNYQLFGISKDRKHNSSQLANIRGEVIAKNLRGRFLSFGNGLIRYKEQSSGKEGMLNCYGQFLVPSQYEEVCFYSLYRLNYKEVKALKKAGVWGKYTEYQLKTLGIIYARNGQYITLYDQCGIQLTSPKKFKSLYYADIIKKYLKKVIIPHFSRKGAIVQELQQKVVNPNIACYDEHKAFVTTLPIYSSNKTNIVSYIKHLEANPRVEKYSIAECYNRGKAYYDKNKYTEAIPWLLRAAEGKYRPAYRKLADSYNNANQPEQAWNWYGSCVGGDGCDFSGNDYWYACMMLGNMFKVGRGCEKNLDSALHFLREFYKTTTPINKQTASEMISEVMALKNKANAPRQQTARTSSGSRSQSSSNSGTITAEDFMRHSDVGRPSYGSIPTNVDIYMKSTNKDRFVVNKLWFFTHNGDYILKINNGGPGLEYKLTETTSDSFLFQPCRQVISSSYNTFNSINVSYQTQYGSPIVIRKDWSQLIDASMERYFGKKILTSMATKAEYDAYMKASTAMVNMFQAMSGDSGGGGSSVAPAQIQSGMSAEYYQNLYRQYERLAESAYRSLTSTGVSVRYDDGSREGSTLGSWEGSNYVGMKVELGKAQREMQRIRSEAAREGHHIMQSSWETATVSH